jgi:MFS family permease
MGTAFVPLKAYYLKVEAGLGADQILVFTALQYCGAIAGTLIMRNRIDRFGVKPVFRLSLFLGATISIFWYLYVTRIPALSVGLPVAYFLFGISASQWIAAHLKYLPRVCDQKRQALHVSVHSAVIGIIGGLAPIFWGFFVKMPDAQPGVRIEYFGIFFLVLLAAQLILFFYVTNLTSKHRERPALHNSSTILRPFRYLGNMVTVIPERPNKQRPTDNPGQKN